MSTVGSTEHHSLVVRLDGRIAVKEVEHALDRAAARSGLPSPGRLWIEELPVMMGHTRAMNAMERETRRSLHPRSPLRAILLRFDGGESCLVVVSRRREVGQRGLMSLADEIEGAWTVPLFPRAARPNEVPTPHARPHPLPVLLAALVLVSCRLSGDPTTCPGIVRPGGITGGDLSRTGVFDVGDETSVGELLGRARELCGAGDPLGETLREAESPEVGLLVETEGIGAGYRPFPSIPFPMAIVAAQMRDEDAYELARCEFDPSRVERWEARRFARLVEHTAALIEKSPARTPSVEIDILSPDEAAEIRRLGSTPALGVPSTSLTTEFAEVVLRHPDGIAVSDETERLTYRELAERSDRMAAALMASGTVPGSFVGVCADRSVNLVAALIGVLKAGAAYVPLDPHSPADRLAYIAKDAAPAVYVTDGPSLPGLEGTTQVSLDDLLRATDEPAPSLPLTEEPDRTAYVIYTSGSTGRPKGVTVAHGNVRALISGTAEEVGSGHEDVWTMFHSSAFDFSVWEMWGCLLTGGHLVVVPSATARSPRDFHRLLIDRGVTVLNQTPSAFAGLAEVAAERRERLAVRLLIFGGETLDAAPVRKWFALRPPVECRVINMYGITETTVHVTARSLTPDAVHSDTRGVGRAIPGWSVTVRDRKGRVLPLGAPGEIHVGGAGVAGHYLNLPDLTAERFVTDKVTGERLYRSGDRGRMLYDGSLEYLGRLDDQIKIRGFRVELGEIRASLLEEPEVRSAVVVHRQDPEDRARDRLDAYVVTESGAIEGGTHKRLALRLPDYMVPATVTPVAAFPINANGKVDVAALPEPWSVQEEPLAQGETGEIVTDVLDVWRETIGRAVSPDEDFFEVGGNSLLAARMVSGLRERGLGSLAIRDLYIRRTARSVADFLEHGA